jgi:large subunit ribosomal protein L23
MNKQILIIPRISEKTYALTKMRKYVFNVPLNANRNEITAAVEKQYDVKVESVNIVIAKGKVVRTVVRGTPRKGQRSDVKKAYVTLIEGDSIKIFDEEQR